MIKIYPSVFNGTLSAPASKVHAQRLLFASALPTTPTLIKNVQVCDDIYTTMEALESFGCRLATNEDGDVIVEPFAKNVPVPEAYFNFKKSATTSRIALAIAAALGIKVDARASSILSKRPLVPLTSRMAIRGVTFSGFSFPLTMQGRLLGGEYKFKGDEGDQYITAMLMALPLLRDDSVITLETPITDSAFIDLTLNTLTQFGIHIEKTETGFFIPGRQQYISPGSVTAENDWALSSMWISAAASCASKGGHIKVTGLPSDSPQKYRNIKPIMSLLSQDFEDITLDASGCPELATLFAFLAATKGATFRIEGIPQLKHMETDRIKATAEIVRFMGGTAEYSEDSITVQGRPNADYPDDMVIDCKDDPYIFMSIALSAGVLKKPIILSDEKCAEKLYTNFLADFEDMGGKFEIIPD